MRPLERIRSLEAENAELRVTTGSPLDEIERLEAENARLKQQIANLQSLADEYRKLATDAIHGLKSYVLVTVTE